MYANVDNSLLSKLNYLSIRIALLDPDIINLTEIKPKNGATPDKQVLQLNGYDLFLNKAYSENNTRGTATYVKSSLSAIQIENEDTDKYKDCVWTSLQGENKKQLLIGNIYRSGTPEKAVQQDNDLHHMLNTMALNREYDSVVITGDFNHRNIKWDTENRTITTSNPIEEKFATCLEDSFLHQLVNQPTRIVPDPHDKTKTKESLLDLVIVNRENLVEDIQYDSHLGDSDHLTLNFKINTDTLDIAHQNINKTVYRYHATDTAKMEQLLDIDWEDKFQNKSADEAYNEFLILYNEAVLKCVPCVKYNDKMKPVKPDWMRYSTENLVKDKHHAWIRYLNTKNADDFERYRIVRNKVTHALKEDRKDFEFKIAKEVKENVKAFWNYVNQKKKNRSKIPELIKKDGTKTSGDKEKADALNDQFSGVFTSESDKIPEFPAKVVTSLLSSILITEDMVLKKLKALRVDKSPGPDQVHPYILKNLAKMLAKPLKLIFQTSLKSRSLPMIWKEGIVTPLYKKESKILPKNYRPVSLTSIVCKVLESIVIDFILDHISINNLKNKNQHGFTIKRSTETNLLQAINIWIDSLAHGFPIDIIYFDFEKAFDRVPHKRLIKKVESFGITSDVLGWIKDFLSDRHQKVIVNGTYSNSAPVTSGVPQGSVLGPVLFLIYVSDMPEAINNFISLFADDTKLFSSIINDQSHTSIQEDINTLASWSDTMLMKFNIEKCHVLHLGANNPKHDYVLPTMEFHEEKESSESYYYLFPTIDKVMQEKDLGVTIDEHLNFETHIQIKISKANQMSGIIRHTFKYITPDVFTLLYKTIVRPHVEYASIICAPTSKKYQDKLERVQRRSTKMVLGISDLPYSERLQRLNLPTLYYRRIRTSMILLYKYTTGLIDLDLDTRCDICLSSDSLEPSLSQNTRGHGKKFQIHHISGPRKKIFTAYAIPLWNRLKTETVNATSLNIFKNRMSADQAMPSNFDYAFSY